MKFERIAALGAEVSEVELSPDLPQEVIDEVEQGLLEHRVLFFRNQELSGEELVDFSRRFGESFVQPALAHKYQELLFLENDKERPPTLNTFHQDMTGLAQPPALHMLHAVVVPDGGGDTMWACNYRAYETLSDSMKEILGALTCTHSILRYYDAIVRNWENSEEMLKEFKEIFPEVTHPLVRTHPRTGRKSLFVNRFFTDRINGFTRQGKREPAGIPLPAHRNARILRAPALAPRHAGHLGQPLHLPLRRGRLLAPAPQDAARLRLRRHPLLTSRAQEGEDFFGYGGGAFFHYGAGYVLALDEG